MQPHQAQNHSLSPQKWTDKKIIGEKLISQAKQNVHNTKWLCLVKIFGMFIQIREHVIFVEKKESQKYKRRHVNSFLKKMRLSLLNGHVAQMFSHVVQHSWRLEKLPTTSLSSPTRDMEKSKSLKIGLITKSYL